MTMPYYDRLSDLDLEIVLDNNAELDNMLTRHGNIDIQFLRFRDLQGKLESPLDIDHWPYMRAHVIYEQNYCVSELIAQIARIPDSIREHRIPIHYFDYINSTSRISKSKERDQHFNVHVLSSHAVMSLAQMIYSIEGLWTPPVHWMSENLRLLVGIDALRVSMEDFVTNCTLQKINALDTEVKKYMKCNGIYLYAKKREVIHLYNSNLDSRLKYSRF